MKIGLVLSGGGGKGAYELGVWIALRELGIAPHIQVFSGTSIGAINAALFASGDIESALGLWEEVTIDKLIPLSKLQLIRRGIGIVIGGKVIQINKKYVAQKMAEGAVSKDGAREIIDRYVNLKDAKDQKKICYAACTELPSLDGEYFRITDYTPEEGKEMIIASASLPHIYDCAEVLGKQYVDGGIVDNTPIKPVYEENCDIIIVVLLSPGMRVNKAIYPHTPIIEIIPRQPIGNILTGTLNLDDEAKKQRIKHGYDDTIDLIKPILQMSRMLG